MKNWYSHQSLFPKYICFLNLRRYSEMLNIISRIRRYHFWHKYILNSRKHLKTHKNIDIKKTIEITAASLATISILYSAITILSEKNLRQRNAIFQAWQIINSNEGKAGEGGRSLALEQLLKYKENISGISLENAYLKQININNCVLEKINFMNGKFAKSHFINDSFVLCDFTGSQLEKGIFDNVQYVNSNLNKTRFVMSNFNYCTINNCNSEKEASFYSSSIMNTTISDSIFLDAYFDNANIDKTYFISTDLSLSRFRRCKISNSTIKKIKAIQSDFSLSQLINLNIDNSCIFNNVKFDKASINYCTIKNSVFLDCSFFGTNLEGTTFENCDIINCDFTSAILDGATIYNCDITNSTIVQKGKSSPSIKIRK
jgi:uncharacterized protein YjbI with pentapeptide repeats